MVTVSGRAKGERGEHEKVCVTGNEATTSQKANEGGREKNHAHTLLHNRRKEKKVETWPLATVERKKRHGR